ncbi:MAG: urease accessory protein UreD [Gordonia sp. (in: high G+C Gram-positive bacteria)]|uniref:urease accessory protein UreD n=1 Tax=Gordonia sp. (in: high G+C Gram-positive bacteria) TaxID=84139 RepID=UPI0039E5B096
MTATVIGVEARSPVARVTATSGSGTVLIPRLVTRTERSAQVALVAGGAMLLGGDRLRVRISVGAGCTLELTEVGGMVAYDADGAPSSWSVEAVLEPGATLIWMGLETVVSGGANLTRSSRLSLADGACALIRETTVLGRTGETGGRARLVSDVTCAGTPLLVEDFDVRGDRPVPGVCDDHRVVDTVLMAGRRPSDTAGAMRLDGPGALARYLGRETHPSPIPEIWARWVDEVRAGS